MGSPLTLNCPSLSPVEAVNESERKSLRRRLLPWMSKMVVSPSPATSAAVPSSVAADAEEVPGSYGPPFIGNLVDKFNYFWFQGRDKFFLTKMKKYNSTVIRLNMPPGPPFFPDSRTVMLLDQKSFPVLFDMSKVEKKDVFTGTYVPSTAFTGGFRVLSYLDPSEPKHAILKNFAFEVLKSNGSKWIPQFDNAFQEATATWEDQLASKGKADFTNVCQQFTLNFLLRTVLGRDPAAPGEASLGTKGPSYIQTWLLPQLAPQANFGLPKILEMILFHTFPLPYFLVSSKYKKIYKFFETYGTVPLSMAGDKFGLSKEEACHNLLFFLCFNTWGGLQILYPSIVIRIAAAGLDLQTELATEVRKAVQDNGGLNMKAIDSMELVHSTVYEVLRTDPPVPFQYARTKSDLIINSYDAAYKVKKGQLIAGYQGITARDPNVFTDPETFQPKRFMGDKGQKLLQNLIWSNGPETGEPSIANKQCAGKNFVIFLGRLFVAELSLAYDSYEIGNVAYKGDQVSFDFTALNTAPRGT
eukprot:c17926_g1_i1 orf=691-2274(-)